MLTFWGVIILCGFTIFTTIILFSRKINATENERQKNILLDVVVVFTFIALVFTLCLIVLIGSRNVSAEVNLHKKGEITIIDGKKIYHRYDCHPERPELDEIEEIRHLKGESS